MDGIDGLTAGDPVTTKQMRALLGCGLHPLAELRQQQEGPDLIPRDSQEPTQLGVPFRVVDGGHPLPPAVLRTHHLQAHISPRVAS
jgi:hypothetical protein